jgi:hypothetical protein
MTTHVVALNAFGVALAADSAVTVEAASIHGGGHRIYDTAQKITPLPSPHRIAVLHCGAVRLAGTPFEIVLREWAAGLLAPLATVEDYARDLLACLALEDDWFDDELGVGDLLVQLDRELGRIAHHVECCLADTALAEPAWVVTTAMRRELAELERRPALEGVDDEWLDALVADLDASISSLVGDRFGHLSSYDGVERLAGSLPRAVIRATLDARRAQLTFTGFGAGTMFASTVTVGISARLRGRVVGTPFETSRRAVGERVFDLALGGQRTTIDRFLSGVDPRTRDVVATAVDEAFDGLGSGLRRRLDRIDADARRLEQRDLDDLVDRVGCDVDAAVAAAHTAAAHLLGAAIESFSNRTFLRSLHATMTSLPLPTLASVTASLVGLEILHQTVTGAPPTVGGTVDVAIITRHGGFEWVQHRHVSQTETADVVVGGAR